MDSRFEAVVRAELAEQVVQRLLLGLGETGDHDGLVIGRDGAKAAQHGRADVGQVQLMVASVALAAASQDEPLGLERVDEHDDSARRSAEPCGERALADPAFVSQEPQDAGLRRGETKRGEQLGESRGRQRPELAEQVGAAPGTVAAVHGHQDTSLTESFIRRTVYTMNTCATPRRDGPPLGPVAVVSFALVIAGLVIAGVMSGGDALASPFAATSEVVARIREHRDAVRVTAFFQLGSAVPLGIFSAGAFARQQRLGIRVPGPVIGLTGGLVAMGSLFLAAFATYVESRPEVTVDGPLTHALAFLAFAAGGPGYAIGLGLLFAGIAVPAYILRLLPRWLAAAGLVLAVVGELTWLSMLATPFEYLIPVARFLGGIWLIAVGFLLPTQRPRREDPRRQDEPDPCGRAPSGTPASA